jgi:DNA uptake protein ComE-like DNA-binding protein
MWKKFVQEYLSFSRQDRRGIVVLCTLILICWCVPAGVRLFQKKEAAQFSSFSKEAASFYHQQDSLDRIARVHKAGNVLNADDPSEPFPFDPNTLAAEGWIKLGIPMHQVRTIQHYLAAGGHFYRKEDLKRIYGISPEMYKRLEPYIRIQEQKQNVNPQKSFTDSLHNYPKEGRRKDYNNISLTVDVNTADSAVWVNLPGIGPVLSSRILRFREALGGFHSTDQIAEVYGLPDSIFQRIKRQLKISPFHLKKLNINTATVEELKSHPYISYRLANAIKAFRDQHGCFDSIEELKQLQLVNDQIYLKLAPYLTVK